MGISLPDLWNNLFASMVWAILAFVTGFLSSRVWNYLRKHRPLENFWRPILSGGAVIILPNPRSRRPSGGPSMWDAVGLAYLIHSVTTILPLKKLRIVPSDFVSGDMTSENLILIASPYANKHVGDIFSPSTKPTRSRFESNILFFDNIRYEYSYDTSRDEGIDYALILITDNPYNPSKSAVILAGCAGFGTYEALRFVSEPANLRKILKGGKNPREIILRVNLKHRWPVYNEIIQCV
jgi:hypothetical protein